MTSFKYLPALCALLCAPALAAEPAQEFNYWSAQLGAHSLSRWPATVDFGGPTVDASLELQRGVQFGATLGKQKDRARYELEYQHGRIGIERATVADISEAVSANGSYDALTANALRLFSVSDALAFYAGAGIGVARTRLPGLELASGCKCVSDASKTGFTWQVKAGLEQRLGEQGLGFVQLGWLSLPGPEAGSISYPRRGTAVLGVGYRSRF